MAEFKDYEDEYNIIDKRISCPYNKSHVVPIERLTKHLVTCMKQHPHVSYAICPLNSSHHVKAEDLTRHIMICSSKDVVEKSLYKGAHSDLNALPTNATVNTNNSMTEDDENWDSEPSNLSELPYDPKLEALYKPIFRRVPLELGASGKKCWRKVEEERIKRIQIGDCIYDLEFPTVGGGVETIEEIITRSGAALKEDPMYLNKALKNDNLPPVGTKPETKTDKTVNIPGLSPSQNDLNNSPLATNKGRRRKKKGIKLTELSSEIETIRDFEFSATDCGLNISAENVNRSGAALQVAPTTLNRALKVDSLSILSTKSDTKADKAVNIPWMRQSQNALNNSPLATNNGRRKKIEGRKLGASETEWMFPSLSKSHCEKENNQSNKK